jgi:predicted TIM-barrel fold metal-dependent hydrolase
MSKDSIVYFDCFTAIGRHTAADALESWSVNHLLQEMQRCHIHAALAFSQQAREVHPGLGNPQISELCRQHDNLYPCWIGLPHQTNEFPKPDRLVRDMEAQNVRALKIYPRIYEFPVDECTLGPLLSTLQEAGILLIVDAGRYGDAVQITWEEVNWICQNYPRLNLLLHSVRWEATRTLAPMAVRYPNLHLEFSNYQGNRMLEFWCETIGHERLLFGSEAPGKSCGAARAYIDYADITPEQKKAIAAGNLLRLLRIKALRTAAHNQPADRIVAGALQGQAITHTPMIDSHAHITHEGGSGASRVAMIASGADAVVRRNRKLGVQKTCVSAWTAIWGDYEMGNLDTLKAMHDFPQEIVGYASLDPHYVKDWQKDIHFLHEQNGFLGLKPYHPMTRAPYDDPRYQPWYTYGNQHRLFALLHYSDNFMAEVRKIAPQYPDLLFILAHSGTSWKVARQHVELAKEFPNVILEITFTSVIEGIIEYMTKEIGSTRVLYGSDAPMRDPYPQFGWVAYADLSEEDKENILGKNMLKILQRCRGKIS